MNDEEVVVGSLSFVLTRPDSALLEPVMIGVTCLLDRGLLITVFDCQISSPKQSFRASV
jgi:hypothetical protein